MSTERSSREWEQEDRLAATLASRMSDADGTVLMDDGKAVEVRARTIQIVIGYCQPRRRNKITATKAQAVANAAAAARFHQCSRTRWLVSVACRRCGT